MQLKLAVCEDDRSVCEDIKRKILKLRPDYAVDVYYTGEELTALSEKYDMIFLDIELPGKNGMSIAKELREKNYSGYIIFLTSYTEFMAEAFKVKAFRFLEKPLKTEELQETLAGSEKEIFENKQLIVTEYGAEIALNISEILYIEARKNKTRIYTMESMMETSLTLRYWQQELGTDEFIQVHKSYIVALKYIKAVDADNVILHETEEKIPISRRRSGQVKQAFFDYIRAKANYM